MNKYKTKGSMLLELMLSIFILGIVLIACLQSASLIIRSSASINNINIAVYLFNQLFWKIDRDVLPSNETGDFGEKYPNFRWRIKTEPVNDYLNQVHMIISWEEQGKIKDIEIVTISNKF